MRRRYRRQSRTTTEANLFKLIPQRVIPSLLLTSGGRPVDVRAIVTPVPPRGNRRPPLAPRVPRRSRPKPWSSTHRLRRGLQGYLIPFDPHAFAPQRQLSVRELLSLSVFLLKSTNFTSPLEIPFSSHLLKFLIYKRLYLKVKL